MLLTLVSSFVEMKLDAGKPGRFKGYGSTFGNVDLGKDKCIKGCFFRSLKEHQGNGTMPAMNWMHDNREPVGDWISMDEDAKGLAVEGQLWTGDQETEASRKARNLLMGTSPKGLSIGYRTRKYSFDEKSGIRSLEDVDLPEVSVVGYGMNPKAIVTGIKARFDAMPSAPELEAFLRDSGLTADQAKALLVGGYKAIAKPADVHLTEAEEIRQIRILRALLRGEDSPC